MSLPLALMKCLKRSFLAAIVPRLFLIIFQCAQPILIRESIRYVVAYPAETEPNQVFWLVLSAVTVYVGLAVSMTYGCLSKSFPRLTFRFSCQEVYINIA